MKHLPLLLFFTLLSFSGSIYSQSFPEEMTAEIELMNFSPEQLNLINALLQLSPNDLPPAALMEQQLFAAGIAQVDCVLIVEFVLYTVKPKAREL